MKPNALFRPFFPDTSEQDPSAILHTFCVVEAVTWLIEEKVWQAQRSGTCPTGRLPTDCSFLTGPPVGHYSQLTCHPSLACTLHLLCQRFWWPSMIRDASSFIAACPVCTRGKPSRRLPAGLLHPLPVPLCPVNQTMEDMLRCVAARNLGSWSTYLPWVEYATSSLVSAASGMSPFSASLGYQSPLFEFQEDKVAVPSVRANLQRCRRIWKQARTAFLRSSLRSQRQADRDRAPAPSYTAGQKVWLSTRDLPPQVEARKLALRFVGPFEGDRMVNPVAVHLYLPASLNVHPTFHISQVKPVQESALVPPPASPPRVIDGGPAFTVRCILDVRAMAVVSSTWLTGWATCPKTSCGSLGVTSWTGTCFGTFIGITRGSRVGCQETSVVGVGGTVLVLLGPPAVLFIFFS